MASFWDNLLGSAAEYGLRAYKTVDESLSRQQDRELRAAEEERRKTHFANAQADRADESAALAESYADDNTPKGATTRDIKGSETISTTPGTRPAGRVGDNLKMRLGGPKEDVEVPSGSDGRYYDTGYDGEPTPTAGIAVAPTQEYTPPRGQPVGTPVGLRRGGIPIYDIGGDSTEVPPDPDGRYYKGGDNTTSDQPQVPPGPDVRKYAGDNEIGGQSVSDYSDPNAPMQDQAARLTPQEDEDRNMREAQGKPGAKPFAPARRGIPTGREPAASHDGGEGAVDLSDAALMKGIPQKLIARAKAGSVAAHNRIQVMKAVNRERIKDQDLLRTRAVQRDASRAAIEASRASTRNQNMLMDQKEREVLAQDAKREYQTFTGALQTMSQAPDDLSINDPSIASSARQAMSAAEAMYDKTDDGRYANVTKTKTGYKVDIVRADNNEIIDTSEVNTVADLKRISIIAGQTIMGEKAGEYHAAVRADDISQRNAKLLENIQTLDLRNKQRIGEGVGIVDNFLEQSVNATPDQRLDPEWQDNMRRQATLLHQKYPELTSSEKVYQEKDADGNARGRPVKVKANGLFEVLAVAEPKTTYIDPKTGKMMDAQDALKAAVTSNLDATVKAAGGTQRLGELFYKNLLAQNIKPDIALSLAKRYAEIGIRNATTKAALPTGNPNKAVAPQNARPGYGPAYAIAR